MPRKPNVVKKPWESLGLNPRHRFAGRGLWQPWLCVLQVKVLVGLWMLLKIHAESFLELSRWRSMRGQFTTTAILFSYPDSKSPSWLHQGEAEGEARQEAQQEIEQGQVGEQDQVGEEGKEVGTPRSAHGTFFGDVLVINFGIARSACLPASAKARFSSQPFFSSLVCVIFCSSSWTLPGCAELRSFHHADLS